MKGVDIALKGKLKLLPEQTDEAVKKVEDKVNKVVEEHSKSESLQQKVAEIRAENRKNP